MWSRADNVALLTSCLFNGSPPRFTTLLFLIEFLALTLFIILSVRHANLKQHSQQTPKIVPLHEQCRAGSSAEDLFPVHHFGWVPSYFILQRCVPLCSLHLGHPATTTLSSVSFASSILSLTWQDCLHSSCTVWFSCQTGNYLRTKSLSRWLELELHKCPCKNNPQSVGTGGLCSPRKKYSGTRVCSSSFLEGEHLSRLTMENLDKFMCVITHSHHQVLSLTLTTSVTSPKDLLCN